MTESIARMNPLNLTVPRTPLRRLDLRVGRARHTAYLKMEMLNPTGSIKYRTALGLLRALHNERPLVPGTTIVESTSGNLGLALAHLTSQIECAFVAVVDPKVPANVTQALAEMGARVVEVRERDIYGSYLLSRLGAVNDLLTVHPGYRWTDQYRNPVNPRIHRETTAREIAEQTQRRVDVVFAAVSTGGTLAGISEGLRELVPGARIHAVDAVGSRAIANDGHPHLLTGIGASRRSSFLHARHYEQVHCVADVEAFAYCRMAAQDSGVLLGGSTGAVLAAFAQSKSRGDRHGDCPVLISPDGGEKHRDTFYNDEWLARFGVLDAVREVERVARQDGVALMLESDYDEI